MKLIREPVRMGRTYDQNTHTWLAPTKAPIPAELMSGVQCLSDVFNLIRIGSKEKK